MRGKPAAADHKRDAKSVAFRRLEDVHCESGAGLAMVNDVFGALKIRLSGGQGKESSGKKRAEQELFHTMFKSGGNEAAILLTNRSRLQDS